MISHGFGSIIFHINFLCYIKSSDRADFIQIPQKYLYSHEELLTVCSTFGSDWYLRKTQNFTLLGLCTGKSTVSRRMTSKELLRLNVSRSLNLPWCIVFYNKLQLNTICWALQTTLYPTPGIPQEHDSTPRRLSSVYPRQATHVLLTKTKMDPSSPNANSIMWTHTSLEIKFKIK